MNPEEFEIVKVTSGAQSLRSLRYNETFHPVVGPMIEARGLHVVQHRFIERANQNREMPFIIWDVGLGAAANAIAILESFRDGEVTKVPIEVYSFDRSMEALHFALEHATTLGYFEGWEALVKTFLEKGVAHFQNVTWRLQSGDFRETVSDLSIPAPQSVIFDPYSPASNPELWTVETFSHLRKRVTDDPCLLTSYSRSTSVRTTFLYAGWFVGKGAATGEKQETTVVGSHLSILQNPLEKSWLQRVAKSGAPGPLTNSPDEKWTSIEVASFLEKHPQFLSAE
ncbi:MAG: MnmC family methyltransferase [Verrucomicrobiota bacterium]